MKIRVVSLLCAILLCGSLFGCASKVHINTDDKDALIDAAIKRGDHAVTEAITAPSVETQGEVPKDNDTYRIIVDPGHGFDDGGTGPQCLGDKLEKDVVLSVAMQLVDKLEGLGFEVVLTHNGEWFPRSSADNGNNIFDPMERTAYANTLNGDFFVSIHCNSFEQDSAVNGIRLYYYRNEYASNEAVVSAIEGMKDTIDELLQPEKKVLVVAKDAAEAYYVTKYVKAVSILAEIGFVTNEQDAKNMLDEAWGDQLAQAMADSIYSYFYEE